MADDLQTNLATYKLQLQQVKDIQNLNTQSLQKSIMFSLIKTINKQLINVNYY
jgi:hypothetical protein